MVSSKISERTSIADSQDGSREMLDNAAPPVPPTQIDQFETSARKAFSNLSRESLSAQQLRAIGRAQTFERLQPTKTEKAQSAEDISSSLSSTSTGSDSSSKSDTAPQIASELIRSERSFLGTLKIFKRLYNDASLMDKLTPEEQNWVKNNRAGILDLEQSVGNFLARLHAAVGVDATSDPGEALVNQGAEQRENAYKHIFEAFEGPEFMELLSALPQFASKQASFESFATKQQAILRSRSRELTNGQDQGFEGHLFNPATPVMQRSFRYKMLLDELVKSLPREQGLFAKHAQEAARSMGDTTNGLQPSAAATTSTSPPKSNSLLKMILPRRR